jgi:hypothetical protein
MQLRDEISVSLQQKYRGQVNNYPLLQKQNLLAHILLYQLFRDTDYPKRNFLGFFSPDKYRDSSLS